MGCVQLVSQGFELGDELREDENLVAAFDRGGELLEEGVFFALGRNLAELHQHRENLELRLGEAFRLDESARIAAGLLEGGEVVALGVVGERTVRDLNDLVRQVFRDGLFHAAHDEGMDLPLEAREGLGRLLQVAVFGVASRRDLVLVVELE